MRALSWLTCARLATRRPGPAYWPNFGPKITPPSQRRRRRCLQVPPMERKRVLPRGAWPSTPARCSSIFSAPAALYRSPKRRPTRRYPPIHHKHRRRARGVWQGRGSPLAVNHRQPSDAFPPKLFLQSSLTAPGDKCRPVFFGKTRGGGSWPRGNAIVATAAGGGRPRVEAVWGSMCPGDS